MGKYIKPKSLTWYTAMVPLAIGLFIASEPLHGMSAWVATVDNMTGNVGAYPQIVAGLGAIGMRAAV